MNKISTFICLALGALLLGSSPATAQQYGPKTTFWGVNDFTNATGTASNLAAATTMTKNDQFTLWVVAGFTNPCAGNLNIQWDCSADGVNYLTTNNPTVSGSSGWFSIPLTNSGTKVVWATNITVGTLGFWRINWFTNAAGQSMTNVTIQAYVKPVRSG